MNFVFNGWPGYSAIPANPKAFYEASAMLSVSDGMLVFRSRLSVAPKSQRAEILGHLQESHQVFRECSENAEHCLGWSGLHEELKTLCDKCTTCLVHRPAQTAEPTALPSHAWEKIGGDLCTYEKQNNLVVVNYCYQ